MNRCPNCGGSVKSGVCEYCDTVWEKPSLDMEVLFDESFVVSLPIRGTEKRAYFNVRCDDCSLSVEQNKIEITTFADACRRYVSNNSVVLNLKLRVLDKVK